MLGPLCAGALAEAIGASAAVSLLVLVNLLCIPVIWLLLPETRGISLTGARPESHR